MTLGKYNLSPFGSKVHKITLYVLLIAPLPDCQTFCRLWVQERIGNIVTCKGWGHCSFSSSFLMLIKMMEASTHVHEYIDPGLIKILSVISKLQIKSKHSEILLFRGQKISIKSRLNCKYLVRKNQSKNQYFAYILRLCTTKSDKKMKLTIS